MLNYSIGNKLFERAILFSFNLFPIAILDLISFSKPNLWLTKQTEKLEVLGNIALIELAIRMVKIS